MQLCIFCIVAKLLYALAVQFWNKDYVKKRDGAEQKGLKNNLCTQKDIILMSNQIGLNDQNKHAKIF